MEREVFRPLTDASRFGLGTIQDRTRPNGYPWWWSIRTAVPVLRGKELSFIRRQPERRTGRCCWRLCFLHVV